MICQKYSSRCYVHDKQHQPLFCLSVFLYDFSLPSSASLQDNPQLARTQSNSWKNRVYEMLKEGRKAREAGQANEARDEIPRWRKNKNKDAEVEKSKCLLRICQAKRCMSEQGLITSQELLELSPLVGSSLPFSQKLHLGLSKMQQLLSKGWHSFKVSCFSLKFPRLLYLCP